MFLFGFLHQVTLHHQIALQNGTTNLPAFHCSCSWDICWWMLGELSQCSPEGLCALYIWFNNSHYLVFQPWPCTLPSAARALLIILCFLGFICFHKFLCMARIFLLVLKFTAIYLQSTELLLVSYLPEGWFFFPHGGMWWVIQWTWFVSSFKTPVVHGSNWQPQNYPSCCSKVENCFPEVIVAVVASSLCWLMKGFQTVWWKYWVYFEIRSAVLIHMQMSPLQRRCPWQDIPCALVEKKSFSSSQSVQCFGKSELAVKISFCFPRCSTPCPSSGIQHLEFQLGLAKHSYKLLDIPDPHE